MSMVRPTGAQVNEIAGDWLAREDAGRLGPQEQAALDAWLAADARHLGAYLRLRAASARLDQMTGARRHAEPGEVVSSRARPHRRQAIAAGLAAAVLLAGGGGYWASLQPHTYRTDVGEMRRVTLRDGSVVSLNTDTLIRVGYSKGRRDVWLSRGEGHFIVAKDRTRPFVVHAEGASVTAVGTAFTVRAELRQPVRVTVTEGVVSVSPPADGANTPSALVGAMQEAALAPGPAAPAVKPVALPEIERRLAWTSGKIMLEGQTLAEAAAEFNRYNERKLIVSPGAGAARVGGVFRTSEVETFARTAGPSLGLSVRVDQAGDIVMEGRPTQAG